RPGRSDERRHRAACGRAAPRGVRRSRAEARAGAVLVGRDRPPARRGLRRSAVIARLLRMRLLRALIVFAAACGVAALFWWRGPDWGTVGSAFDAVRWQWVAVAIGLNLVSVLVRANAWRTVINQAMPPPHPSFPLVFSAFSVGLFANAVLPGRIGELARVATIGFGLFAFAFASARSHQKSVVEELGPVRRLLEMARHGLGVLHAP